MVHGNRGIAADTQKRNGSGWTQHDVDPDDVQFGSDEKAARKPHCERSGDRVSGTPWHAVCRETGKLEPMSPTSPSHPFAESNFQVSEGIRGENPFEKQGVFNGLLVTRGKA